MKFPKQFPAWEFFLSGKEPHWLIDLAYLLALKLVGIRLIASVPLRITSFFRTPDKNKDTEFAAKRSLHMRGLAVDFTTSKKNKHLLRIIYETVRDQFDYGELFLYELEDGSCDSIHYSLPAMGKERVTLIYVKVAGKDGKGGELVRKTDYIKMKKAGV